MKKLVFSILLFFHSNIYGQINPEWVACYDSTSAFNLNEYHLKVSKAGNVYVTGANWDTIAMFNVLLKYDTYGNLIWSQTYDSLSTYVGAMTIDAHENIYVTGRYLNDSLNGFQYRTLKYDSTGTLLWEAGYAYLSPSYIYNMPYAITVDDSENVYVTGVSYDSLHAENCATIKYNASGIQQWAVREDSVHLSNDIFVDSFYNVYITGTEDDSSGENIMTVKYDQNGIIQWKAKYHEYVYCRGYFITMDLNGDLLVGGYSDSNADSRIKILKYGSNGNLKWISEFDSTTSRELANDMKIDQHGNIYFTGVLYAVTGMAENYLTVKFDSSGQVLWARVFDGGAQDDAYSIALDSSGNVYISGTSESSGYWGFVTIKYDNSGNQLWQASYGNSIGALADIGLDSASNVYVSGALRQTTAFKYNIVTLKYGSLTEVPAYNQRGDLIVFPNPASTEFQISNYEFQKDDEIILRNVLGKISFSKKITAPTLNFKLQTLNFPNGIYFLQVKTKEGILNKKVVVQH